MKKVISLLLAIITLISMTISINLSAYAESSKNTDSLNNYVGIMGLHLKTGATVISPTKARVICKVEVTNGTKVEKRKVRFRKAGETTWKKYETVYSTPKTSNFTINQTISSLCPNTNYEYCIGLYVNGAYRYYSIRNFTTPDRYSITAATANNKKHKYTGSAIDITSIIDVYYNGNKLKYNKDYTLSITSVTSIGKHYITIYGKGDYKDSRTVRVRVYPKTPTIKSIKYYASNNKIAVKWSPVKNCTKQQIAISRSSNMNSSNTGLKTYDKSATSATISYYMVQGTRIPIKKGQTYYIKMRAYKIVNGEKIYGEWGKTRSITCN
ncbi:MAG: hypothetical protein IJI47_01965 [Eubacterium sp.]|nr:hypothetical protein [Eubacterium sp.]